MSGSIAPWTPLGASEEEVEEFLALREGVPPYLYESIIRWIRARKARDRWVYWEFLVNFQAASRMSLGVTTGMYTPVDDLAIFLRTLSPEKMANLLDYMLGTLESYHADDEAQELEKSLAAGGSSWAVGVRGGRTGLVARMPASVVDVVASVTSTSDKAGAKLSQAWDKAYGPDAQPSDAYVAAVRAVEILLCPLVSPNNDRATLGTAIRDLRNQGGSWTFAMKHGDGTDTSLEIVGILQLLWKGQNDRHGSGEYADVTIEEAQAAVLLASTIVGWLAKGMLRRK
ncbi:hypothetical protein QMA10_03550 [Arthrobacter sp. APC 3897]|uniref:hypothetical protein n=1 Tax=Arthrobacter sp. APC 3897 TaxID=3035204 RepID=UPI0025B3F846|nr:hypothetical protein [Arthrobacter sp. APC 3897]MDN3480997.1 hypothetical protein [Arthrobacter sp. APC 3897]